MNEEILAAKKRLSNILYNYNKRWSPSLIIISEKTFKLIVDDVANSIRSYERARYIIKNLKMIYYDGVKVSDVDVARNTVMKHFKKAFNNIIRGKDPDQLKWFINEKLIGPKMLWISWRVTKDTELIGTTLEEWCRKHYKLLI